MIGEKVAVEAGRATYAKVFTYVISFLFVLYFFSFLDRINIGFAALSMNKELGLTSTSFGVANTIFYFGYMAFEIPSNLALARVGARRWIARIMVTWGIASTATMFAQGETSLYLLRLLVGIAEAGFVPGVLLYLTFWFPQSYRARANGTFMIAQPLAIACGAILSGYLLKMDGLFGLSGWRWLFLIEGLPSILLGVVTFFYLSDRPRDATWLDAGEKAAIEKDIARETSGARDAAAKAGPWRELASAPVVLLCIVYFCLVSTLNTNAVWVPQIVREIMKGGDFVTIGLVAAIPALLTVIAMPLWSARSDRRQERLRHLTLPILTAALGWLLVVFASQAEIRFLGLIFVSVGAFCAMSIFWTLPAGILSLAARPAGIALISTAGIFGSAISPSIIGMLRDATGSFASGLIYMVALLVVSIACVLAILAWPPHEVETAAGMQTSRKAAES
ncbi:MFS transporter, ACS family, 4-hydroxyphenylacetate permease [Rhizobiales bacterium GAS113]|nr:MFS transporter, ACS family, 4-hydroxyphenylacetate permease [Rhizobiales bacterium GAS113]